MHVHPMTLAAESHQQRQAQRRDVLLERAMQRGAQLKAQLLPHQIHDVAAERAARGLHVAAG